MLEREREREREKEREKERKRESEKERERERERCSQRVSGECISGTTKVKLFDVGRADYGRCRAGFDVGRAVCSEDVRTMGEHSLGQVS